MLLVDAAQGVQAQTVSNFYLAFANDLAVIPVLNKVDLKHAVPETVKEQLFNMFEIDPDSVISASAKTGIGIPEILTAVKERIPPPNRHGKRTDKLRLLLQDSWYDRYKGCVNLVQVIDGVLRLNDQIASMKTEKIHPIKTLSILTPEEKSVEALYPGQIGFFTCNVRSTKDIFIGDTFHRPADKVEPLSEVTRPNPMVFAGFYPQEQAEQSKLKEAIEKVSLNDCSVDIMMESSPALGVGWRLGFLGVLHMEVFTQRLQQEYDANVVVTQPAVPYKQVIRKESRKRFGGEAEITVTNPENWISERSFVEKCLEPMVRGTLIVPQDFMTPMTALCGEKRGQQLECVFVDQTRLRMEFMLPLSEIVTDFFDAVKRMTSGYGTFDYELAGYQEANLVKVDMALNGAIVPELAFVCHKARAREKGKKIAGKMKEELPRQQYDVAIQAKVGATVIARENLKALRKDVLAKCYGGDLTRQMKLLKNQAKGKQKMRSLGNVQVSKDTFIKLLSQK